MNSVAAFLHTKVNVILGIFDFLIRYMIYINLLDMYMYDLSMFIRYLVSITKVLKDT
jgi:hypothetical protein